MARCALRTFTLLIFLLQWLPASAQPGGLAGRSRLEFGFALWNQPQGSRQRVILNPDSAEPTAIETSVRNNSAFFVLRYGYWLQENLSVNLSLGTMAVEAVSRAGLAVGPPVWSPGVSQHVVAVFPLLLGLRYYIPRPTPDTPVRPYVAAGAGVYVGYEARNEVGLRILQESRTLTAMGGHLGGGIDIQAGRHVMFGANAGYHFVTDFTEPLGGRENYSGPEFGLGISWLFGKGVE